MTEKNEKPKPPARPKGRVLGGTAKKSASIPPPPAAELTPEQFAAEQAADQSEGHRPAVDEPQDQSTPAPTVGNGLAEEWTKAVPEGPQGYATPSQQVGDADHATAASRQTARSTSDHPLRSPRP